ncbi:MAG: LPS export ABC transporter periplasmic protein LptC [Muribaculaceae bacterium]
MKSLLVASFAVGITTALCTTTSCGEEQHSYVANVGDTVATMATTDVETFISDSGYTRYHITAPVWRMYDEAQEPYWLFPQGLQLEHYDLAMHVQGRVNALEARYFSRKRLWQLDGNVRMVNTLRDSFLTEQLFWDQAARKVYSDSFIHIVRTDRIIEGYGFESNENMTAYIVRRPTGIIPVDKRAGAGAPRATISLDSAAPDTAVHATTGGRHTAAPQRASARRPAPVIAPTTPTSTAPSGPSASGKRVIRH